MTRRSKKGTEPVRRRTVPGGVVPRSETTSVIHASSNKVSPRWVMLSAGLALAALAGPAAAFAAWPMFRGTAAQLGDSPGKLTPRLRLVWKATLSPKPLGPPVVSGGRVFVGAGDGMVLARRQKDGAKIWSYKPSAAIEAAPCLGGVAVVIGSSDGDLYCLNAVTGKLRWKYRTEDKILGAAIAVPAPNGKGTWIVVGSYDNKVHCV